MSRNRPIQKDISNWTIINIIFGTHVYSRISSIFFDSNFVNSVITNNKDLVWKFVNIGGINVVYRISDQRNRDLMADK